MAVAPEGFPLPEPISELFEITPAAVAACSADDNKPNSAASRELASGDPPTAAEVADATAAGRALGRLKRARREAAYVWVGNCCCSCGVVTERARGGVERIEEVVEFEEEVVVSDCPRS